MFLIDLVLIWIGTMALFSGNVLLGVICFGLASIGLHLYDIKKAIDK